jgi:hypothetical protein
MRFVTQAEIDRLRRFVECLCGDARGLTVALNMLASCTGPEPLCRPHLLADFLKECADNFDGAASCIGVLETVAAGRGPSGRRRLRLAACARPDAASRERLTHVLKCESFHHFLLGDTYKEDDDLPDFLPLRPENTESGRRDYAQRLRKIVDNPEWSDPTGALGRPLGSGLNCWVSTGRFGHDPDAPRYAAQEAGTQVRDELGLVDVGQDDHLLRVSFAELSLSEDPPVEVARPIFSDMGNSHFIVDNARFPLGRRHAQQGWGTTVHLGKFRADSHGDLAGVPERVTAPIPVRRLRQLEVEYVGPVMRAAFDDPGEPAEEALCKAMLVPRVREEVAPALLQLAVEAYRP